MSHIIYYLKKDFFSGGRGWPVVVIGFGFCAFPPDCNYSGRSIVAKNLWVNWLSCQACGVTEKSGSKQTTTKKMS